MFECLSKQNKKDELELPEVIIRMKIEFKLSRVKSGGVTRKTNRNKTYLSIKQTNMYK
jgi:hypothetical protein